MSMKQKAARIGLVAGAVSLATTPAALAQAVPGALYTVTVPSSQFGSSAYLGYLTSSLTAAQAFCKSLKDPSLNVDCLAERLGVVADEIPAGSNYAEVRSILDDTSRKLNRLARSNRDRGRGSVRASEPESGTATARPLVPVKTDAVAAVNTEAARILEEAQTVLLRSAEGDPIKAGQYSRIAEALDSNKVLLRSA